jgi:hypothetical protein
VATDLLRTPPLRQPFGDMPPELGIGVDATTMTPGPARRRCPVSVGRAVPRAGARVAAQLAGDRRGRTTHPVRDLPDAQPGMAQIGDLDPLVLGEVPTADLTHRQTLQGGHEPDETAAAVDLVAAGPVVPRGARDADLTRRPEHSTPAHAAP